MLFIIIGIILILIFQVNNIIDTRQFIKDTSPKFKFLMEEDYEFLLKMKYKDDVDVDKLFSIRIRNALIVLVLLFFILLSRMNFIYFILILVLTFITYKQPYSGLKSYYKKNLHYIDLMLPYYLKSLEILVQHYTVPVAIAKSIDSAPTVFQSGLKRLISKIDAGNSTVDPYMDFAKEYPVRDSMRMMRLLYRLSLGSQENKQDQLIMLSKTVSSLQNKSREQRYKERLEKMENKTMLMLGVTGGGILVFLLLSMLMMLNL